METESRKKKKKSEKMTTASLSLHRYWIYMNFVMNYNVTEQKSNAHQEKKHERVKKFKSKKLLMIF